MTLQETHNKWQVDVFQQLQARNAQTQSMRGIVETYTLLTRQYDAQMEELKQLKAQATKNVINSITQPSTEKLAKLEASVKDLQVKLSKAYRDASLASDTFAYTSVMLRDSKLSLEETTKEKFELEEKLSSVEKLYAQTLQKFTALTLLAEEQQKKLVDLQHKEDKLAVANRNLQTQVEFLRLQATATPFPYPNSLPTSYNFNANDPFLSTGHPRRSEKPPSIDKRNSFAAWGSSSTPIQNTEKRNSTPAMPTRTSPVPPPISPTTYFPPGSLPNFNYDPNANSNTNQNTNTQYYADENSDPESPPTSPYLQRSPSEPMVINPANEPPNEPRLVHMHPMEMFDDDPVAANANALTAYALSAQATQARARASQTILSSSLSVQHGLSTSTTSMSHLSASYAGQNTPTGLKTSSTGLNTSSTGLNASSSGIRARSGGHMELKTSSGNFLGLNASSTGLNTSSPGLNTSSAGLNTSSAGLNASSGGLNTSSAGLNSSSNGLNTSSNGLNVSTTGLMPRGGAPIDVASDFNLRQVPTGEQSFPRDITKYQSMPNLASKFGLGTYTTKMILSGKPIEAHQELNCAAFHVSGEMLASGGGDHYVKIWDTSNHGGVPVYKKSMQDATSSVLFVQFSATANLLCGTSNDKNSYVWDPLGRELHTLTGHTEKVTCAAFLQEQIFASCSWDRHIKLFDLNTGYCTSSFSLGSRMNSMCLGPYHLTVCTAHVDKTIRVIDCRHSTVMHSLEAHSSVVNGVCSCPDNPAHVLTSSKDNTLKLIELRTMEVLHTYKNSEYKNQRDINITCFSPNGKYVVAGGDEGKIFFWNTHTAKTDNLITCSAKSNKCVTCVTWNPKRNQLIACHDNSLYLYDGEVVHSVT